MYIDNYSQKAAVKDLMAVIAYRVKRPDLELSDELTDAEDRLLTLNPRELIDVVCVTLASGIYRTIPVASDIEI